jgi:hypothetical protein
MGTIVQAIIGFMSDGFGKSAGGAVAGMSKLAALAPLALWLLPHKDEIAVAFSYGQLAIIGLFCYLVLELVHRTPPS